MVSKTVKVSDIRIPQAFAKTTPKQEKIQKFKDEYFLSGDFQKRILVTEQNLLVDGYARYVALQELGAKECIVDVLTAENKFRILQRDDSAR